ncbi:MAG: HlyD family secretion protein [Rubrivivax sp.]
MQAQAASHLGAVRIAHRPRHTLVAGVALILAGALVAFAAWAQVTRKARVPGVLVPQTGTLNVGAQAPGTVAVRAVHEGEHVRQGQLLFVLDTGRGGPEGEVGALVAHTLQQREGTLRAELALREAHARQRRQALADRLRSLSGEATHARAEVELARQRTDLAARSAERFRELAASGFVSAVQAQARQEEWLEWRARAQAAERAGSAFERERQALQAEIDAAATQWQAERVQIERALAQLEQERRENDARRQLVLHAPAEGIVTALHAPPGTRVQAGQTLLALVPTPAATVQAASPTSPPSAWSPAAGLPVPLEAELYAPSRTAGFLRPGQPAWLRVAAFPYQKFGMAPGTVVAVSRTPLDPQDLPAGQQQALAAAAQGTEPLFRIRVALHAQALRTRGAEHALRPGLWLEADIVQERRAVWEWILEPALGARSRWSAGPASGS